MKRIFRISAAVLLARAALAAPTPAKPFKASFIGESGGYKHPDQATDQYLRGPVNRQSPPPSIPEAQPKPSAPESGSPRASSPVRPESPSPVSVPARSSARIEATKAQPPVGRPAPEAPSLWSGAVVPLEGADADQTRAGADRDYETRVLGMHPAPDLPTLNASAPDGRVALASTKRFESKIFVSLELDPRESGSLRDAVAGLGETVGFAADPRFQATRGPNGNVLFSGWLPASRLGVALSRPGVKSVRVEPRPSPTTTLETSSEFVIGLRVEDPSRARQGADAGIAALSAAAGFRLTRIIGLETAPDGRSVVVVSGQLPLARLSRAMALPEVAKILPAGGVPARGAGFSIPPTSSFKGFLRFVVHRGPWLIILTLLLALPSLRSPVKRMADVFNPYR